MTMERTKKTAAERGQEPVHGLPAGADAPQVQTEHGELLERLITEYAVTAEGLLNLRDAPSFAGTILAELPRGAGVYSYDKPVDGWLHVHTGRLEGWMLAEYLEELPLPELSACEPE